MADGGTVDQNVDGTAFAEPPPATLEALKDQTTRQMMKKLYRYAQLRANHMCHAGIGVPETFARDIVDEVHLDTRLGVLPWDPAKCKLLVHLGQAIKKRTWLELRRAHRISLVSLPEAANDEMSPDMESALAHVPQSGCNPIRLYGMYAVVCQQFRLVPHDHDAAAIVKCWEEGTVERDEVLKLTGLTAIAYERARKRLLYSSRDFPSDLRDAVVDLLRSAS